MKRINKLLMLVLSFFIVFVLCSCSKTNESTKPVEVTTTRKRVSENRKYEHDLNIIDDNYRNYYEIFVFSFADSNNDGIGDFNGVTSKLDYIKDMGFNGIWLMPICSGASYHKYDVVDYFNVDSQFGTMSDFENFLEEAHRKGIKVIVDLVINHTSDKHPWFINAKQCLIENGEPSGEYGEYYNFTTQYSTGYTAISGTNYYYESQFYSGMPDLNLDSELVRNEIKRIVTFWLEEGVDGFRLDATTSYYTNDNNKNIEFMSWLNTTIKNVKDDAYVVGEAWTSENVIKSYYSSGIDSFFCFPISQAEGYLNKVLNEDRTNNGNEFGKLLTNLNSVYTDGIFAPFLSNHDTGRITSFVGRSNIRKIKMINGLLSLLKGNTFVYYGEEIGMVCADVSKDPEKRIAMLWNKDKTGEYCKRTPDGVTIRGGSYYYPSVEEQYADSESILRYYRYCNYIRNTNPEIARADAKIQNYYFSMGTATIVFTKEYNGSKITIVVNLHPSETKSLKLQQKSLGFDSLYEYLCVDSYDEVTYNAETGEVTLPSYSIAIFR